MSMFVAGLVAPDLLASPKTVHLASMPSPPQAVWHLGPVPVRAYALCILLGIFVAMWLSNRRWLQRGGQYGFITDVAVVAVPMGLLGGRLYHVITTPGPYFGEHGNFWRIVAVWEGGLGIWGAIALGGVGAWLVCRRRGIPLQDVADVVAPGLAFAQAIGRWGNWFNQELYGRATSLFWGLRIDEAHRPADQPNQATYHPTFLYESVWNVGVGVGVLWAERRWRMDRGRTFALYVAGYTVGRTWIEMLRIDTANTLAGMRINVWVSLTVLTLALLYLVVMTWWGNRNNPPARRNGLPARGHAGISRQHSSVSRGRRAAGSRRRETAAEQGYSGSRSRGYPPVGSYDQPGSTSSGRYGSDPSLPYRPPGGDYQ